MLSLVSQMNWGEKEFYSLHFFTGDPLLECEGRQVLCEMWQNGAEGLNNVTVIY
jgi:hypothetical protein